MLDGDPCFLLAGCLFWGMTSSAIRVYDLRDPRQREDELEYWRSQSYEARLEAVEILRRQFTKFAPSANEHGSSQRLRRVLRVVQ